MPRMPALPELPPVDVPPVDVPPVDVPPVDVPPVDVPPVDVPPVDVPAWAGVGAPPLLGGAPPVASVEDELASQARVPSPIKHTLSQWLFLICMNLSEKKMAELRGAGKPRAGRISDYKSFVQLLEVSKVRFMWSGAFVES